MVRIQYNTCQMFITGPGIQLLSLLVSFGDFSPDPMQLLVMEDECFFGTQERYTVAGQRR